MKRVKTRNSLRAPASVAPTIDIKKAAEVIKKDGLVIFPSDTVYILAVDPTNQKAVDKLLAFKNRWTGKAISIAVLDKKMAEDYVVLNENAQNIYANLLPGPFTIVSNGKHKVARGIEAENGTLGIRIPDNKWIHELVMAVGGPVTATSANLSGRTPNYTVNFVKKISKKKQEMIDLIVDAGKLPRNKPSTVVDATESEVKILRRGDLITGSSQTLISKSEKETEDIAKFLLNRARASQAPTLQKPLVFGLTGDLGCGKTVFSRKIGQMLGVKEKITSPTFVIYNEYIITNNQETITKQSPRSNNQSPKINKFLHFDLYRLAGKHEFEEIEFLNQFPSTPDGRLGLVACIEWPEIMGEENFKKLKEKVNYVAVEFGYVDEKTREIKF